MKCWVNIMSLSEDSPPEILEHFQNSPPVQVFSSVDNRVIGKTIRYEIRNKIDLYAEFEIDDNASPFPRAAGLITKNPDESFSLRGVLATDLPREDIVSLGSKLDNMFRPPSN